MTWPVKNFGIADAPRVVIQIYGPMSGPGTEMGLWWTGQWQPVPIGAEVTLDVAMPWHPPAGYELMTGVYAVQAQLNVYGSIAAIVDAPVTIT